MNIFKAFPDPSIKSTKIQLKLLTRELKVSENYIEISKFIEICYVSFDNQPNYANELKITFRLTTNDGSCRNEAQQKKPSLVEVKRKQNAKLNICFIVAQPAFHKFMI